jgi:hypothetical protein
MSEIQPFMDTIAKARMAVDQFNVRNNFGGVSGTPSLRSSISGAVPRSLGRATLARSANPYGGQGWQPTGTSTVGPTNPYQRRGIASSSSVESTVAAIRSRPPTTVPGGDPGGSGSMGNPTGGGWENVNRWNNFVQSASNATGIPANVIKAIMMIESGGEPNARSPSGYLGLMQIGPGSANANEFDWSRIMDPAYNIMMGARELAAKKNAARSYFGREPTWAEVAGFYFGWGGSDALGTSTGQYMQRFTNNMNQLSSGAQQGWGGGGGTGSIPGALNTMFPGRSVGFAFGVESNNGLYGYGTAYGLNGRQHTGMDVMMPMYTPIYAPANARVVCVGCWRNDHIGGGVGRIELEMPDGARILYDHSNSATVQVGQMVQAGQMIGRSGGMISPHIHLEVRVPNGQGGYRLVDPAQYFGGMVGAPNSGGGGVTTGGTISSIDRIRQILGR